MTRWEIWTVFLGYAVPMIISPGPGNTLLAAAGSRYGLRKSLPFWVGFETGNLALCILYGMGLGSALHEYPQIHAMLKWAGVAYMLYLAWGFFRASAASAHQTQASTPPGPRDGFICVVLNPKIHSMIVVMFAQFLSPGASLPAQVAQLSAAFIMLGVICHFPWIYGGQIILGRFNSARAVRTQAALFGTSMLATASYLAWS